MELPSHTELSHKFEFLTANNLLISFKKTNLYIFQKKKNHNKIIPDIIVKKLNLKHDNNVDNLGLTFDMLLSWNIHIEKYLKAELSWNFRR